MIRRVVRSDRYSAVLLLGAATLGLLLANSAVGPALIDLGHRDIGPLSLSHWISDLLLAVFFVIVAAELKYELTHGQLNTTRKALVPALAALGGVVVPALLYLALAGPGLGRGWPIPTATDIAFALGVLAVFGRGLPGRLRVFLLALAVLDDLIGILFIAIIFTSQVNIAALLGGVACILVLAVASRMRHRAPALLTVAMIALAVAAWYLVMISGVHPTIAGVGIGLALVGSQGTALAHHLQPWSNGLVLPLFAFSASLVAIPAAGTIGPVVLALAIALPVGKAVGITLGGVLGAWVARKQSQQAVLGWDLVTLAVTGGIGFTIALLMNQLAFRELPDVLDQGVLGVLAGSAISVVAASLLIAWRARVHRRRFEAAAD
jgi:NhaA family Na+:H+ antiporter